MLCWFLPYNNPNQSQLYIYIFPLPHASHATLPLYPSRSSQHARLCVSRGSGTKQLWVLRTCAHFLPPMGLSFPICVMGTMMASKRCHKNTVKEGLYKAWRNTRSKQGLKKKRWPWVWHSIWQVLGVVRWRQLPHPAYQQCVLSTGFLAQPTETVCASPAGVCVLRVCVCD